MPVRIRLRRVGTKKKPYYRIVAVDSRKSTRGKILELLGHYGPIENPVKVDIDIEKVDMWVKKGAQLSDTVKSILKKAKKPQKQEKAQSDKGTEAQSGKQKGTEKKVARKTTSGTKAVQGKKTGKGKQAPKKSKKKVSRAH
ncbi:30S ribosomal protein S16 [bacterium]|nr:30S ribosomal protein S16 [bacterium]